MKCDSGRGRIRPSSRSRPDRDEGPEIHRLRLARCGHTGGCALRGEVEGVGERGTGIACAESGARPQRVSIIFRIEVVSYWVWSTKPFLANGEMTIVGTRVPGPQRVDRGRRDVVPAAAVLVVGDDDGGVVPVGAVLDGVDQVGHVLLALQLRLA